MGFLRLSHPHMSNSRKNQRVGTKGQGHFGDFGGSCPEAWSRPCRFGFLGVQGFLTHALTLCEARGQPRPGGDRGEHWAAAVARKALSGRGRVGGFLFFFGGGAVDCDFAFFWKGTVEQG